MDKDNLAAGDTLQCSFSFSDVLTLLDENLSKMTSGEEQKNEFVTDSVSQDETSTTSNIWNTTMSDKVEVPARFIARISSMSDTNSEGSMFITGKVFDIKNTAISSASTDVESDPVYCWIPKSDKGFQTHNHLEDGTLSDTRSTFSESTAVTKGSSHFSSLANTDESNERNTEVSVVTCEGEIRCCINNNSVVITESDGEEILAHQTDLIAHDSALETSSFLDTIINDSKPISASPLHKARLPAHLTECASPVFSLKQSHQLPKPERSMGQLHKARLSENYMKLLPAIQEDISSDDQVRCTCMDSIPESNTSIDSSHSDNLVYLRRHERGSVKSLCRREISFQQNSSSNPNQHQKKCLSSYNISQGSSNDSLHSFIKRSKSGVTSCSSEVNSSLVCTCHLGRQDSQWSASDSEVTGKFSSSKFSGPGFDVNSYDCLSSVSQFQHRQHMMSSNTSRHSSKGSQSCNSWSSFRRKSGSMLVPWSPIGSIFDSKLSDKYQLDCIPVTESKYSSSSLELQQQCRKSSSSICISSKHSSASLGSTKNSTLLKGNQPMSNAEQLISTQSHDNMDHIPVRAPISEKFKKQEFVACSSNYKSHNSCNKSKSFDSQAQCNQRCNVYFNQCNPDSNQNNSDASEKKLIGSSETRSSIYSFAEPNKDDIALKSCVEDKVPSVPSHIVVQEQRSSRSDPVVLLCSGSSGCLVEKGHASKEYTRTAITTCDIGIQTTSVYGDLLSPVLCPSRVNFDVDFCEMHANLGSYCDENSMLHSSTQPNSVFSEGEMKCKLYQSYRSTHAQLNGKLRVPFLLCGRLSTAPMILDPYSHINVYNARISPLAARKSSVQDSNLIMEINKPDDVLTGTVEGITDSSSTCGNNSIFSHVCDTISNEQPEPVHYEENKGCQLEDNAETDGVIAVHTIKPQHASTRPEEVSELLTATSSRMMEPLANPANPCQLVPGSIGDVIRVKPDNVGEKFIKRQAVSTRTPALKDKGHHDEQSGTLSKCLKSLLCCRNMQK